jgi:hypothetical protein
MLVACQPETIVVEVSANFSEAAENLASPEQFTSSNAATTVENESTCQNPTPEMAPTCTAIEAQILTSTMRIELLLWDELNGQRGEFIEGGTAHATVINGRYLVTHNHFPLSLNSMTGGGDNERVRLSIYRANGEPFLTNIKPSDFTIVAEDNETLVLNFDNYFGGVVQEGLFAYMGIPSISFLSWSELSLAPGMEVAQINWDNEQAFVQWVNIQTVQTNNGTPTIELTNGVIQGASGGGLFLNGVHIGNNWSSSTVRSAGGDDVLGTYSTVALNEIWALN